MPDAAEYAAALAAKLSAEAPTPKGTIIGLPVGWVGSVVEGSANQRERLKLRLSAKGYIPAPAGSFCVGHETGEVYMLPAEHHQLLLGREMARLRGDVEREANRPVMSGAIPLSE